jgi:hypothetical protein
VTSLYSGPVRHSGGLAIGFRLRGWLGGLVGLHLGGANWLSRWTMLSLHLCSA